MENYEEGKILFNKGKIFTNTICIILEDNIYDKSKNEIKANRGEFLFEKVTYDNIAVALKHELIEEPDCLIAIANYNEIKIELEGDITKLKSNSNEIESFSKINLLMNLSEDTKTISKKTSNRNI